MTELRTTENHNHAEVYAEYEYNGSIYGVWSTDSANNETFYFAKQENGTWQNYGANSEIFTLKNYDENALIRLDLTIKNDTAYIFYSTYNTKNDTTEFFTKTTNINNVEWNTITDSTLNSELVPDLEFGYDPYVADNGNIYVSYATNEYPKSYKLRFYNGTKWDYVVNSTVNTNTEDVTNIVGSIYNNNVYIAYSFIDTKTDKSGLYVKVANNGKWETVNTPENINENTVVDLSFAYTDNGISLDYSVATVENYNTEITTKNYN